MCKTIVRHCSFCGKQTNRKPTKDRSGNTCKNLFCNMECYHSHLSEIKQMGAVECKNCGESFTRYESYGYQKAFCSFKCRNENFSKQCLKNCNICGVEFSAIKWRKLGESYTYARDTTKKLCSRSCLSEFMKTDKSRKEKTAHRGDQHPNWKGGGTRRGFRGHDWLSIAEKCRDRFGRKCSHCGVDESECGRKLDVNHIIPFHQFKNKTKANAQSNLEALCKSCHMKTEWKWRKQNQEQMSLSFER